MKKKIVKLFVESLCKFYYNLTSKIIKYNTITTVVQ